MSSHTAASQHGIPLGEFRRIILDEIRRLLLQARHKQEALSPGGFVRRDPTLIIVKASLTEAVQDVMELSRVMADSFPELEQTCAQARQLAESTATATEAPQALQLWKEVMQLFGIVEQGAGDQFELQSRGNELLVRAIALSPHENGISQDILDVATQSQAFLAATVNGITAARKAGRALSADEQAAVAASYRLLERGLQLPYGSYRGIGTYGFREHQTSLSAANPGDGHITATCSAADLLQGTVVHIEHIDRDNTTSSREVIEPYRLPAAVNAAHVRLHVGTAAPCTAYIGRPIFENGVENREGVLRAREFKIDLLNMSAAEAIAFLRAVAGNVMRDGHAGQPEIPRPVRCGAGRLR
jgi:hypothetical protein